MLSLKEMGRHHTDTDTNTHTDTHRNTVQVCSLGAIGYTTQPRSVVRYTVLSRFV